MKQQCPKTVNCGASKRLACRFRDKNGGLGERKLGKDDGRQRTEADKCSDKGENRVEIFGSSSALSMI